MILHNNNDRKLFYPGHQPRCACVRDSGAPSTDPGAETDRGEDREWAMLTLTYIGFQETWTVLM